MGIQSNTLLFKLSKEGSERSHYLFGTMHTSNEATTKHYGNVLAYLERCGAYYGEIDFNEPREASESLFSFEDELDITHHINNKMVEKMKIILSKHFDLEFEQVRKLHPMYISALMAQKILSPNNDPPLDMLLFLQAMHQQMETGGLESVTFQEALAKSIPLDGQLRMLKGVVRNVGKFRKQIKNLEKAYASQDLKVIYHLSKKSMGALREKLIYQRNRQMANRVVSIVNENRISSFMCCGAAHFWGQYGMLSYIKKGGVKIEAVSI
ncbi:MAG: TraB/GumN family protein [Saprospiraceae bacterium]|nr:TraB/GumN family protein [Saprospiraceae bacterium]